MNDQDIQDIFAVLTDFRDALNTISQKVSSMEAGYQNLSTDVNEVRGIMFDSIINPAKSALEGAAKQDRFDEFSSVNGDKLNKYNNSLKAIEGDDFDLVNQAFEEYDNIDGDKPDAGEFGDAVVELVEEQLAKIREATNIPEGTDLEITQDGDTGEIEVKADDDEVDLASIPVPEGLVMPTEEVVEEEKEEEKPYTMDDYMAELEKEYK